MKNKQYFSACVLIMFLVGFLGGSAFFSITRKKPQETHSIRQTGIVILPDVTGKKVSQVQISPDRKGGEFDGMEWTFGKKFSPEDIKLAQTSVAFIERLTGLRYIVDYSNMYWSDDIITSLGKGRSLLGMTVYHQYREEWRAYVAITTKLKPQSVHDLNAMRDFGSTVIHECLHSSNLDIEELVRAKIEKPIDMSFDFHCSISPDKFYTYGLDNKAKLPYAKMIEKIAHESGIQPPWHYSRDFVGEPVKQVIQLFMIPPTRGTNSN